MTACSYPAPTLLLSQVIGRAIKASEGIDPLVEVSVEIDPFTGGRLLRIADIKINEGSDGQINGGSLPSQRKASAQAFASRQAQRLIDKTYWNLPKSISFQDLVDRIESQLQPPPPRGLKYRLKRLFSR